MSASIPVNIITGALGAGKTTAIAQLLANKPVREAWVVILNEFTDTGIDALTLATSARGAYDVRMIPGGCLCCTGEEDFRRQLSGLLAAPAHAQPARILIEPSGIAHPGAIVDELRGFERSGAVRLMSTIALIESHAAQNLLALTELAREQVDAADVVVLSKAELANEITRECFTTWANELFPAKRYVGFSERGTLPELALNPPPQLFSFEVASLAPLRNAMQRGSSLMMPRRPHSNHSLSPEQGSNTSSTHSTRGVSFNRTPVQARTQRWLGRVACGWLIPAEVMFDLKRLETVLHDAVSMQGVERMKAVVRTGIDQWHLVQRWATQCVTTSSAWRQDSRIEIQLKEGVEPNWEAWDSLWQTTIEL